MNDINNNNNKSLKYSTHIKYSKERVDELKKYNKNDETRVQFLCLFEVMEVSRFS